jgi:hypothetical protein
MHALGHSDAGGAEANSRRNSGTRLRVGGDRQSVGKPYTFDNSATNQKMIEKNSDA